MKLISTVLLVFLSAGLAGCARTSKSAVVDSGNSSAKAANDAEEIIKSRTVNEPTSNHTTALTVERQIVSDQSASQLFVYPVSITVVPDRSVYVSDNNAHLIRVWAPDSNSVATLPTPQGKEALQWPNAIRHSNDSLFVSDDQGIKMFGRDGSLQRILKSYYAFHDFVASSTGTFYINPRFRTEKKTNPLIVELTGDGTKVRGFGDRFNHTEVAGLDDEVYLAASPGFVVAVYKHLPLIHFYDHNGKLIKEISLEHPVFSSLKALAEDRAFVHPGASRFRLPTYVAGASVVGDHIFILLHLPQPEIVEFTLEGKEVNRYRGSLSPLATIYRGFDAQLVAQTPHFWVLAGDEKVLTLTEFSAAKPG